MVEDNEFEVRSSNTSQRKIDAGDVRRLEAYVNLFQEKIDSVKDNISELTSRIESLEAKKKRLI